MRVLQVTNMWPDDESPYFGIFVKAQVESLRGQVSQNSVVYSRSYTRLRKLFTKGVSESRPQLVHAHFGYTAAAVADLCLRHRLPLVVSYCGGDLNGEDGSVLRRTKAGLGVGLSIAAGFVARRLIVKSQAMLSRLPDVLRDRVDVVPNGVDTSRFAPMPRAEARRTLGWNDHPRVVFGGRASDPTKRFELAEEAFRRARSEIPELELSVLEGVAPEKVPLWLNAADVVLFTSRREGSPNVIKEAMACDAPILSVPVGDVSWLLEGVDNARVCPPDPDQLASAMVEMLGSDNRKVRGGRDNLLKKGLDLETIAAKIYAVYTSLNSRESLS